MSEEKQKFVYSIDVTGSSRYHFNRRRIKKLVTKVLEKEGLNRSVEVSVAFVGSRKMKQLNKKYRNKDYVANVLSFCLQDSASNDDGFLFPVDEVLYLGDVVVCYPVARKQAGEYFMFVDEWIDELVRHSLEHLLGRHHA